MKYIEVSTIPIRCKALVLLPKPGEAVGSLVASPGPEI